MQTETNDDDMAVMMPPKRTTKMVCIEQSKFDAITAVLETAKKLIEKMKVITQSQEYYAVWSLAYNHGMPYKGDKWEKEFNDLCSALEEMERKDAS
jgi:hypothetical protein